MPAPLVVPLVIAIISLALGFYFLAGGSGSDGMDGAEGHSHRSSSMSYGSSGGSVRKSRGTRVVPPDEKRTKSLRDRLVQAGLYRRNSKSYYAMMQVAMAALPLCGAIALVQLNMIPKVGGFLMGVIGAGGAILFPSFWLDHKKKSRQIAIKRSLPDALDVIVVCVEAGLSIPASLQRVTSELRAAHGLLAFELDLVYREVQLGTDIGTALKHFADRFDLEELRSLSAVVMQAERYGSSTSQAPSRPC